MSELNVKNGHPPIREKLRNWMWYAVQNTLFQYSPFFCFGWRRFLLRCFGAKIAKTASTGRHVRIDYPWCLEMEAGSTICNFTWLMCAGRIKLGKQAQVSEYARLISGSHDTGSSNFKGVAKPIELGAYSWVGACSVLVSGIKKLTIGEGAIVGTGSVVMRNVKPWTVVVGNPAKFLVDRELPVGVQNKS